MSSSNNSQVWMVEGFVQHSQGWTRRSMGVPVDFLSSTPSDGANSSGGGSSSNDYLLQSLRARQLELDQSEQMLANRFRQAECVGNIAAALPDWVRRIDVCYPLLAAGECLGEYLHCPSRTSGEDCGKLCPKQSQRQSQITTRR